ncbi:hypothetical protein FOXYS1_9633 [Fusarium oxysporum]|uniref:Zn(2)-C6 fungal-type domain-containing protein n=2 Tax=Fusarium oxysporum TaxID=5507 RepID=A0A8H5A8M2_FUSOX|nr:hypothetical protein FOZG_14565 [Fusarium oxysporum Fo47]KAF5259742.1 hypothetical protein FOXYS1_9633 [Fusarium oxysporum]
MASPLDSSNSAPYAPSPRLNRACDACRLAKLRCLPDGTSPVGDCQRCSKSQRSCVYAPVKKRKPRARTNTRITKLEGEVRAMMVLLENKDSTDEKSPDCGIPRALPNGVNGVGVVDDAIDTNCSKGSPSFRDADGEFEAGTKVNGPHDASSPRPVPFIPSEVTTGSLDVVQRGILNDDLADELVAAYVKYLNNDYPGVDLPNETKSRKLRSEMPVLWLAVLAAASHGHAPELAIELNGELAQTLGAETFNKGTKSIELVHALHIATLYYNRPTHPSRDLFFQYASTSSSMFFDLSIAHEAGELEELSSNLFDSYRRLLFCYLLSSGLALRLRRPSIVPYNDSVRSALSLLETLGSLNDRRLVRWVELHRVIDETATYFGLSGLNMRIQLSDSQASSVLQTFEEKMGAWMRKCETDFQSDPLMIEYQSHLVTMYEIVLSDGRGLAGDHADKKFHLPPPEATEFTPFTPSKTLIALRCVEAAKGLLDRVIAMDPDRLRWMPNVLFVRMFHGLIILIRLSFQLWAEGFGDSTIQNCSVTDFYVESILASLVGAACDDKYAIPAMWAGKVGKEAKSWSQKLKGVMIGEAEGGWYWSQQPPTELPPLSSSYPMAATTTPQSAGHLSPPWLDAFCGEEATVLEPRQTCEDSSGNPSSEALNLNMPTNATAASFEVPGYSHLIDTTVYGSLTIGNKSILQQFDSDMAEPWMASFASRPGF